MARHCDLSCSCIHTIGAHLRRLGALGIEVRIVIVVDRIDWMKNGQILCDWMGYTIDVKNTFYPGAHNFFNHKCS